ncbi:Aldo/keto reductase [Wolfiporia cocos MD-104 SS10]|uniref:Aldo/keto reductase n=1 Tax=Wolfiporia cocos (strain MD-104) TaxID=742152 RepID=A0A2H3JMB6_WOLCO|nr:Aldo/keto reductase [Wolfiporia cocos MD-104 SS10]
MAAALPSLRTRVTVHVRLERWPLTQRATLDPQRGAADAEAAYKPRLARQTRLHHDASPHDPTDGTSIPWLGFGSGTAHYLKDASGTLSTALALGVRHLDTAQVYGNEASLAPALAASRLPRAALHIGVERVGLFLVRSPHLYGGVDGLREVWREAEEVQREGLARSIGVSNFTVQDFEALGPTARVVPAVNQIEYHPYLFTANVETLAYMKARNSIPVSYGGLAPLTQAELKDGPVDPVLAAAAARLSTVAGKPVSKGQVLHLWLRARGMGAITTSTQEERIREYVEMETLPDLTEDELRAIDEAGAQRHHSVYGQFLTPEFLKEFVASQPQ